MPELNGRQRKFVTAYVASGNATQAAETAGFKHPRVAGSKLLKVAAVAKAIRAGQERNEEKSALTRERVLELCHGIAEGREQEEELSLSGDPIKRMPKIADRLKAMSLASRLCGWDAPKKLDVNLGLEGMTADQLIALAKGE